MRTEVVVLLLVLVANGIFAMAELAVVAVMNRRFRLKRRAESGDRRARAALALTLTPTEFLSTVQVGISLVGIFAGAYSGATLASDLQRWLSGFGPIAPYSEALALAVVVGGVTYLSLVIGELVPKAIALHNPEAVASWVAVPVAAVARVATPLVWVVSRSTGLVLRPFGIAPTGDRAVTEEEIRALIEQAVASGHIPRREQEIVEQVFRLGDRKVSAIMTPRHDIEWVDVDDGLDGVRRHLAEVPHPKLLVCDGGLDAVVGVVRAERLLATLLEGKALDLRAAAEPPLFVPASMSVFQLVEQFRGSRMHLALVLDEFGAIEGLVTPTDILEGLVGEMPSELAPAEAPFTVREDGSWLVDGTMLLDDLRHEIDLPPVPRSELGTYQTLAGLVMTRLGRVPRAGDHFTWGDLRFEVVDMDGRRVDKVLVSRRPVEAPATRRE